MVAVVVVVVGQVLRDRRLVVSSFRDRPIKLNPTRNWTVPFLFFRGTIHVHRVHPAYWGTAVFYLRLFLFYLCLWTLLLRLLLLMLLLLLWR